MKKIYSTAVLISILLVSLPARSADLEAINTEAYLSMMDADKLLEEKKPAEALGYYQNSLKAYEELKKQDPAFKTQIVDYRIDLLTRKIDSLKQQLPDSQTQTVQTPETDLTAEKDFKNLYLQTREKMVQDSNRLLVLEKRNIQMTVTLRERQQDVARLQAQVNDLESQLRTAKIDQSRALTALDKEVKDLRRFNTLLQDRADKLEMSKGELEAQRKNLLNDGREMRDNLVALQEKFTALETELAQSKSNATLNEQRLILSRNQLQDDLKAREQDLAKVEKELDAAETRLRDLPLLEESVIELNTRNETQLKRINDLQAELAAAKSETAEKQSALEQAKAAQADTLSQLEKLQQEKADWTAEQKASAEVNAGLEKQLAGLEKTVDGLRKDLEDAQRDRQKAEAEREEVLKERSGYRDEIKALTREKNDLETEMDRLRKGAGSWDEAKTKLEEKLAERNAEIEASQQALKELQDTYREDTADLKNLRENGEKLQEMNASLQKALERKNTDLEVLAKEVSTLRTGLGKETENSKELNARADELDSLLKESEAERKRLALNLKQESDQRQRLEKNAGQQLNAITDRMNEIISLRQKISKLEVRLKQAEKTE